MTNTKTEILSKFPVLHTDRLDLIEITQNHLTDLFELFGNDTVTEFYNIQTLTEEKEAQKFVEWFRERFQAKLGIRWGIALKGNEQIIGTIGFNNFTKNHRANLGYDLKQEHWNKGFITEALKEVVKFGFDVLEIHRVEAEVMLGNIYSEKALIRVGFKREGLLRDWMFWNEKHYDMIMYSLLRKEL